MADLSEILRKAKAGFYLSLDMYRADVDRMLANCRSYNKPSTPFYMCADKLDAFAATKLREVAKRTAV